MLLRVRAVQIILVRQNGLDQIGVIRPILRHVQQQRPADTADRLRVRLTAQRTVDQHRCLRARERGGRRRFALLHAVRRQRLRGL